MAEQSLKAQYEKLTSDRAPYLQRARDCAKFTLPWLLPPQGSSGSTKLRVTFSSFGARCVNSLAAKLLLALFPARQTFFRLAVSKPLEQQLGGKQAMAEIQKALSSVESEIQEEINSTPTRTPAGEGIKHLLVAGNVLIELLPKGGGLKLYPLDRYVCQRDSAGNPLKIIFEERIALGALPESIRSIVKARMAGKINAERADESEVTIYTGTFRRGNHWEVYQEVEGVRIPESRGTFPLDALPYFPLRWIIDPAGDYGRSMVEDYLGHLISLESLTASLVKGTAVAAKVVFLRKPNSQAKATKLTQAETGAVIDGNPDDVAALQVEKRADFATARELIGELKEELAFAFVMNQAVQRHAERVTAEEIRFMAQELDSSLGGNYSTLALEFQLPYLRRLMVQMQQEGKLPMLPKGALRPIIVTGLDALGRGADLDNLKALVADVVDLGGPQALQTYMNFDNLLTRLTTARGVTPDGLIKTPQEVAQAQEQSQMQAMIERLGPNVINQIGGVVKETAKQE